MWGGGHERLMGCLLLKNTVGIHTMSVTELLQGSVTHL